MVLPSQDGREPRGPQVVLTATLTVSGIVLVESSGNWLSPPASLVMLLVGALLLTVAAWMARRLVWLIDRLIQRIPWERLRHLLGSPLRWLRYMLRRHPHWVRAVAAVTLCSLALTWALVPRLPGAVAEARIWWSGCGNPTGLRIMAEPAALESARQLASAYELGTAEDNYGCPTVDTHVYSIGGQEWERVRKSGWAASPLALTRPRPDLLLLDSTIYGLPAADPDGGPRQVRPEPFALSPIVLAVPAALAADWMPSRFDQGWRQLLSTARDAGRGIVRPDPAISVTGELTTVSLYREADDAGPVASPDQWRLVPERDARAVEAALGRSGDEVGSAQDDTAEFLCRYRMSGSPVTAVVVTTEQTMVRFNSGLPLGGSCASRQDPQRSGQILVGFYPTDTFALDHTLVELTWADTSVAQAAAASGFREWLRSERGRRATLATGSRHVTATLGDPVSARYGASAVGGGLSGLPQRSLLDQVQAMHQRAKTPGRVLLALDTSGSMGNLTRQGVTRLAVAADAIRRSLKHMGDRDEFGLFYFPGAGADVVAAVPIARGDAGHRRRIESVLDRLRPSGDTPLHAAILDGMRALPADADDRLRALVVVTDGVNTAGGPTERQLLQAVRGKGVPIYVITVGEARCGTALTRVVHASGGSCVNTDFDDLEADLDRLFTVLFGGNT